MHLTLGQHGFGKKKSAPSGGLATAPKGGGNVQRFTRGGQSPPACPSGARSVNSGTYGTGAQTKAWRDCEMPAPRAVAPPPPPPPPRIEVTTQVSPAIQTQISPQISPVMTQMQASPGAGVVAAPQQQAPAPMYGPGPRAEEVERLAQRRREEEEYQARRLREQEAYYAEQTEARRLAEEAAEQRRMAIEAQSVTAPVPAPAPMGPVVSAPLPAFSPQPEPAFAPAEPVVEEREPNGLMLPLLIAAAVGVGALVLTQGKKRRKR